MQGVWSLHRVGVANVHSNSDNVIVALLISVDLTAKKNAHILHNN